MAAVAFLLFLVVLHATGTFSDFRYQDYNFHRPSGIKAYPNQFLAFRDLERLYRDELLPYPVDDRIFDYEIFPSSWDRNDGRDSSLLNPLKEMFKSSVSLNSDSASASEKLQEHARRQTPETPKNFEFPTASSGYPIIIMNTSSLSSATANKTSEQLSKSEKDNISSILDEENVVLNDDDNVSTGKLHSAMSDEKDAIKHTSLEEENKVSKGNKVIGEITDVPTTDVKPVKENIKVGKEISDSATDVANIHGKTTANEETSDTTIDEDRIEGKTIATEEISDTTIAENEIDRKATAKEETNDITVGDKINGKTIATEETSDAKVDEEAIYKKTTNKEETNDVTVSEKKKETITVAEDTNDKTSVEEGKGKYTTANKDMNHITTVKDEIIDVTNNKEKIRESTTDIEVTDKFTTTESRDSYTTDVPKKTTNDIPETADNDNKSTQHETTLPTDDNKTEGVSDISSSSKVESTTTPATVVTNASPSPIPRTVSTGNTDGSSKSGYYSTMSPDSKSSNSNFVTESVRIIPEHIINIRSIKTAKTVLAVLLLATAIIAVAVLAVYFFRVRRRSVQYDQLTLLP